MEGLIRHRVSPLSYGVIYLVTNTVNKKRYVGQTVASNPIYRWREHLIDARRGVDFPLHKAIRKYGEESFTFNVIWVADSKTSLDVSEDSFITFFETMSPSGYNLRRGGANGKASVSTILKTKASWTVEKRLERSAAQKKLREDPIVKERYEEAIRRGMHAPESRARVRETMATEASRLKRGEIARINNARPGRSEKVGKIISQKRWINNGIENRRLHFEEPLPEGWSYGMVRYKGSPLRGKRSTRKKSLRGFSVINNGIRNAFLSPNERIPKGWTLGRIKK